MSFDEQQVSDPTWMRAMAHPLRWQILDVLRASPEPLTATEVSDEVGESPANCSFHLRTLAKYGFIEEAGGGKGRSRPWRARDVQIEIRQTTGGDAPEGAEELRDLIRSRSFRAIETWEHGGNYDYPQQWRDAAMSAEWELKLTREDVEQIQREFRALLDRYADRADTPDDAVQTKVLGWVFPVGPPPDDSPTRSKAKTQARGQSSLRSSRSRRTSGKQQPT